MPRGPPSSRTSRSRASVPLGLGHGCPGLQLPSISRAATPAMRILGPSAHHTGPSPSQTAVGVHTNVFPWGTTWASACQLAGSSPVTTIPMATLVRNRTRPVLPICTSERGDAASQAAPLSTLLSKAGPRANMSKPKIPLTTWIWVSLRQLRQAPLRHASAVIE